MDLLQVLHDSWFAVRLRQPGIAYPLLNAAHILSLALVVGPIAILDLRLLGVFRTRAIGQLAPPLIRTASVAAFFAIATGFLLFSVRPAHYVQNPAFLLKISLVALGIAVALALGRARFWRAAILGNEIGAGARLCAILSLAIWVGAVLCGRWIAFVR
jgi:hypothetical protein